MKSYLPQDPGENREWIVIDAARKPLGRLAVEVANRLRGRNKPTFSPQVDTGDFVVVVNASKVKLTGRKNEQKQYLSYSGHRGGLKAVKAADMRERHPDRMITQAVKGMLPRNTLNRKALKRLKVYAGGEHPHVAQNPSNVDVL